MLRFLPFDISKDDVMSHYPLVDFLSPQQCYDQISTDINIICPNLEFARVIAAASSSYKKAKSFYVFMLAERSAHLCDYETRYCPLYAYHSYDLDVINFHSPNLGSM